VPTYLDWFQVDWAWPALTDAERVIVRRYHATLESDPQAASADWLADLLATASAALPGRSIYARGGDIDGEFTLIARDGRRGDANADDFDEAGAVPDAPTSADYKAAGVEKVCQALYFPEDMLQEIQNEATRQDKSLSWMAQKAWLLARSEIKTLPKAEDV
jgi:uncharacterized small protein (TIGR04563 family)